jgi:electron transport complex protein RnfG
MPAEVPRRMATAAGILAAFAVAGVALVALTHRATGERIAANEREYLLRSLRDVLPEVDYDNALHEDWIAVTDPGLLGTAQPVTVYRARRAGRPVATVLTPVAPGGYNGPIRLLVGILADGTVSGVRVVAHRETPGLGDKIEVERSDWVLRFAGRGLGSPPVERWGVRKDGGEFDSFTGATITPRAVVHAVRDALIYFRAHREALFGTPARDAPAPPPAEDAADESAPYEMPETTPPPAGGEPATREDNEGPDR